MWQELYIIFIVANDKVDEYRTVGLYLKNYKPLIQVQYFFYLLKSSFLIKRVLESFTIRSRFKTDKQKSIHTLADNECRFNQYLK